MKLHANPVSFEFAAQLLGTQTSLTSATASSIEKGESLVDTARPCKLWERTASWCGIPRPARHKCWPAPANSHHQRRGRHA